MHAWVSLSYFFIKICRNLCIFINLCTLLIVCSYIVQNDVVKFLYKFDTDYFMMVQYPSRN